MRRGIDHPKVEAVREARQEFLTWREKFPQTVRDMREAQREWHWRRLEDAILEMFEAGASLRYIAEVYGTKDTRVITKAIKQAKIRRGDEEPDEQDDEPQYATMAQRAWHE